jgi:predicted TIM-barrel fold metal-dependent hydrolase
MARRKSTEDRPTSGEKSLGDASNARAHADNSSPRFSRRSFVRTAALAPGLAAASLAPPLAAASSNSNAGSAAPNQHVNRGGSPASPLLPLGTFGHPHNASAIRRALQDRAAGMWIFDTHEHLWHQAKRMRENPDLFLLFSHYTSDDLISAGMPAELVGSDSLPRSPFGLQDHAIPLEERWKNVEPFWKATRTTGYGRCMLIAARDLFGVEDINESTFRSLSERITAANADPNWYRTVLKTKARIFISLLDDLTTDWGAPLSFEPEFFWIVTRMDYIVTTDRESVGHVEKVTGVSIASLGDLERALGQAIEIAIRQARQISPHGLAAIKCALAYQRTLLFEKVAKPDAERAFAAVLAGDNLGTNGEVTRKLVQDYLMYRLVGLCGEHHLPMQIHTGMQAGNRNHVAWTNPALLSALVDSNPQVSFDIFHGGYPYWSEQATLCKNNPNCYADLCWMHIISPGMTAIHLRELIETVPANKILGFGGDFFHVEGAYAHAQMARGITAAVLAEQVENGYLKENEAELLLERILFRNAHDLFMRTTASI